MNESNLAMLGGIVDKLALIKAQIADLKLTETRLKQDLIDSGFASIDGTLNRAAISECDGKTSVDWKKIAEKFSPSRQLVTANTTVGDPYFTVRVSARKS